MPMGYTARQTTNGMSRAEEAPRSPDGNDICYERYAGLVWAEARAALRGGTTF